jgi:hypothetical protein
LNAAVAAPKVKRRSLAGDRLVGSHMHDQQVPRAAKQWGERGGEQDHKAAGDQATH